MVLRHRFEARHVELAQEPLQGVAALAGERDHVGAALTVVAGVEDDEAALLHVGVDLGDDRIGKRFGQFKHRPVENGIERDLVLGDVDGGRLAGLDRRPRFKNAREAEQSGPARLVRIAIAADDVGERHFRRRVDGGFVGGGSRLTGLSAVPGPTAP